MRVEPDTRSARQTLIRDAAVFQFKLVLDGLRDLLLVPVSLVGAVISLIDSKSGQPGPQFHDVLAYGKRTENWIDLFGALRDRRTVEVPAEGSLDAVVNRMEAYVIDEYRRGGITKQAKDRIDQALNTLHQRGKS
ncbi:MAG: hypothetical protein WD001_01595 [Woeseia sp.]